MPALNEVSPGSGKENRIYAKITWRLVPLLFLFYVVGYLDRVNIGFAKLDMLTDLHWTDTVYGLGAGMFFWGYFLFEIPSNIILHKVGPKRWIAFIMLVWGLISASMMFVTSTPEFYILRFSLGLAEAGLFPGIIFLLGCWYPGRRLGGVTAIFLTAIAFSGILGGPLSGLIMQVFKGVWGLAGWQWLFVLEGLPCALMSILAYFGLEDSIDDALWLNREEKDILQKNLAEDSSEKEEHSIGEALRHFKVWQLSGIYFLLMMGLYGVSFWLPQVVKSAGVKTTLAVGLLSAIPYGAAVVIMTPAGRHSDATGERKWHIAFAAGLGGLGFVLSGYFGGHVFPAMLGMTLAAVGVLTAIPLFYTLPSSFLTGIAAAAGIGLINSIGNLAGFVCNFLVGKISDITHSLAIGFYVIALCLFLCGFLIVLLGDHPSKRSGQSRF